MDQKVKADSGKHRLTLVPSEIIWNVAAIREYGFVKYREKYKTYADKDVWKEVDIQRWRDAAFRHWLAYLDNSESRDKESGLPHLWHLACNIAFLCELEKDKFKEEKLIHEE